MQDQQKAGRLGRSGRIIIILIGVFGALALLLYLEQLAIIYIGSALALIVLLIVVAFSDLESIGVNATKEAYMTSEPDPGEVEIQAETRDIEIPKVKGSVSPANVGREIHRGEY